MKWVAMFFTAAGLGFLILSFFIKQSIQAIEQGSTLAVRLVYLASANIIVWLALVVSLSVRRRAIGFANRLQSVERVLRSFPELEAHFKEELPGSPVMAHLIRLAVNGLWLAQTVLLIWLFRTWYWG